MNEIPISYDKNNEEKRQSMHSTNLIGQLFTTGTYSPSNNPEGQAEPTASQRFLYSLSSLSAVVDR